MAEMLPAMAESVEPSWATERLKSWRSASKSGAKASSSWKERSPEARRCRPSARPDVAIRSRSAASVSARSWAARRSASARRRFSSASASSRRLASADSLKTSVVAAMRPISSVPT